MLWGTVASLLWVGVGLAFYLHDFSSMKSLKNLDSARARPVLILFKALSIFLILAGLGFFLWMAIRSNHS